MSWKSHIQNVAKCCFIRIRAIYAIRKYFNSSQLKQLCESFVLSVINYMIPVYGTASGESLRLLCRIIRTVARLTLNVKKHDPISQRMYSDLKWLLPVDLCHFKSLCLMYKLVGGENVDMFDYYFRRTSSARRINNFMCGYYPKKEVGRNVFHYRVIKLWNELPDEVKSSKSFSIFKKQLRMTLLSKYMSV